MTSFIALYRADGINRPHIIAVTSDTDLVTSVATEMLKEDRQRESERDPVLQALRLGRRNAVAAVASLGDLKETFDGT